MVVLMNGLIEEGCDSMTDRVCDRMEALLSAVIWDNVEQDKKPDTDEAIKLLRWVQDHRPARVYHKQSGFIRLDFCGRCGTIVSVGDQYCN